MVEHASIPPARNQLDPGDREPFQFFHPATGCSRCPELVKSRTRIVWSSGPRQADIMFIGESPGFNEDREGLPFVGAAGRELGKMLADAGLSRSEIHVTNRILCHPEGNRDPLPQEMENCEPWLVEHIRSVQPRAIVTFGRYATSYFFQREKVFETEGLMWTPYCWDCGWHPGLGPQHVERRAENGQWFNHTQRPNMGRLLIASIYHPASALPNRYPEFRPRIVGQLRRVQKEIADA